MTLIRREACAKRLRNSQVRSMAISRIFQNKDVTTELPDISQMNVRAYWHIEPSVNKRATTLRLLDPLSRVRTHYSHQMTAAASAIAAMKFLMFRSKRVAMRLQSLMRQKRRSTTLRCL